MIQQRLRSQLPKGSSFSQENLAQLILTICEFLAEMEGQFLPSRGQLALLMGMQITAGLYEILQDWLAERPWGEEKGVRIII